MLISLNLAMWTSYQFIAISVQGGGKGARRGMSDVDKNRRRY